MKEISALYVSQHGPYWGREDVDPWDETRDARRFDGSNPVVAHPPCRLWINLAALNYTRAVRYARPTWNPIIPAWYPGGTDGGCFAHALTSVRRCGGVLEHPSGSHAWRHHGLQKPVRGSWQQTENASEWVTCVHQSCYGHQARKATWLLYVGDHPPAALDWRDLPGTHQVGGTNERGKERNKPQLSTRDSELTPLQFAELLIALAKSARKGKERKEDERH